MKDNEHESHSEIEYIYQNQINMEEYGLEKNKEFAQKLLTNEEINNFWHKNFEEKGGQSWKRETEPDMDLEKFLSLIKDDNYCVFKLFLAGHNEIDIRYGAIIKEGNVDHFAWLECEYNKNNFDIISKIYKEVFEKDITTEGKFHGIENYFTLQNVPMPK